MTLDHPVRPLLVLRCFVVAAADPNYKTSKPNFSPFGSFPVAYEMTILFGAIGSLLGMMYLNRLPRLHHPLLKNMRFADVTHDKFFVLIEVDDPKYDEEETRKLLKKTGSKHIEMVNE